MTQSGSSSHWSSPSVPGHLESESQDAGDPGDPGPVGPVIRCNHCKVQLKADNAAAAESTSDSL